MCEDKPLDVSSPPLRCLLAITGAFNLEGGIAVANRLVVQALYDAGYTLDVYALNEPSDSQPHYAQFPSLRQYGCKDKKVAFTTAVWRALLTRRYDFVFCDHVNLAAMLAPLRVLKLTRSIVRLNGVEVFPPLPDFEGKLGLKAAWKRLAISDFTHEQVIRQFPTLPVDICDLSIDPRYEDLSLPALVPTVTLTDIGGNKRILGKRVILHVGRMSSQEQYKGQDVLILGLAQILAHYPDTQLVLVGQGDDATRLRNLAFSQPPNIQNAIFMPGFVQDDLLDQLYQSAYVFAMPSRGEGLGLVYLEAMRWACPCIGSWADASQCAIQHGVTGLLTNNPSDPDEVAQLLLNLLDQPELARSMGEAGFNRLKEYFLFPHFKERFLKAIAP